jgi:hypothetical protein
LLSPLEKISKVAYSFSGGCFLRIYLKDEKSNADAIKFALFPITQDVGFRANDKIPARDS